MQSNNQHSCDVVVADLRAHRGSGGRAMSSSGVVAARDDGVDVYADVIAAAVMVLQIKESVELDGYNPFTPLLKKKAIPSPLEA